MSGRPPRTGREAQRRRQKRERKLHLQRRTHRKQVRKLCGPKGGPWYYLLRYHYDRCPLGDITPEVLQELSEKQLACPYCGCPLTAENRQLEHLTPICRGGRNTRDNVAFACATCNADKFTDTFEEYAARIGLPTGGALPA